MQEQVPLVGSVETETLIRLRVWGVCMTQAVYIALDEMLQSINRIIADMMTLEARLTDLEKQVEEHRKRWRE